MQAQSRFMAAPSEPRRKRDFGKTKMDHASFADRLGAGDAFSSHLTATAVVQDYPTSLRTTLTGHTLTNV